MKLTRWDKKDPWSWLCWVHYWSAGCFAIGCLIDLYKYLIEVERNENTK